MHQKTQGQYAVASKKAKVALVLTFVNIVLVLVLWVVMSGLRWGLVLNKVPAKLCGTAPVREAIVSGRWSCS